VDAAPRAGDDDGAFAPTQLALGPPAVDSAASARSAMTLIVIHDVEAARTASFSRAVGFLGSAGLAVHLALYRGGVPLLRHAMTAALVVMALLGFGVWRIARNPKRYTTRLSVMFGVVSIAASLVIQLYLGIYSPFACIIALGLSIFGLVDESRFVLPLCLATCAIYFALASLIAFGTMRDPGLFAPTQPSMGERLGMAAMVLAVYAAALWQARATRDAMHEAIERSNRAVLAAQQREALLSEANRNLDVALNAGAGENGRWSGAVVGSFKLGTIVGRGAMGEVYVAQHMSSGRPAAVKLLHPRALQDGSAVKRFLREAGIASGLHAPNLVRVLEVGQMQDGMPYFAMELLAGHDLGWHLRRRPRMPLAEVVVMIEQLARGLGAAHAAGIVHRDLKPQNVVLHEPPAPAAPAWKVLDFGVSKLREGGGTLTEGGAIVGTPGYIAPEQVRSGAVDSRADVFALGAIAYRALTGQPAFSGHDVQALFDVVHNQPKAPTELTPNLPPDVDGAIAIALAKKPEDRFAEALDFAAALREASNGALSNGLRQRAEAVTSAWPWGKTREAR
jgi:serine/threonine-protein kinase